MFESDRQVVDIAAITRAVDGLEVFPMSMLQLQETRVAQFLQTIRHQVGQPLQKRIRTVIKAWQKLLEPGSSCATIVPLHRNLASNNNNNNSPVAVKLSAPNISDKRSNSKNHMRHHELSAKLPDRKKLSFSSTTAFPNGCSPKLPNPNGRVSSLSSDAPKLAKVKSTAELIKEAGGCIDSVTKDRILSNQIAKESDEFPRLVPLVAMRSSRRAKNPGVQLPLSTPSQHKLAPRNADRTLPPPPPPPPVISPSPQHTPSIPPVKSELIAKFLDLAPPRKKSPCETRAISSDQNPRRHHHKEKRKHGKRRREAGIEEEEVMEYKDVMKDPKQPPVTDQNDSWPSLPLLTEELMREAAETWLRNYRSGRTPSRAELEDVSRVDDLLKGTWPEVSASLDDEGRLQPMTALYSVDLGDDQLMHILPWTNLAGSQQTFFPPGAITASDIDRLIDIPEPW